MIVVASTFSNNSLADYMWSTYSQIFIP